MAKKARHYTGPSTFDELRVDSISEETAEGGLTMDGVLLKDGSAMPIIADPGDAAAIPVTRSGVVAITTAAAETNTLAIPAAAGQRLILCCDVYAVGDRVVTAASAINVAGNTIMTFGAARDCIELVGIQLAGALAWEVVWNNNVALS